MIVGGEVKAVVCRVCVRGRPAVRSPVREILGTLLETANKMLGQSSPSALLAFASTWASFQMVESGLQLCVPKIALEFGREAQPRTMRPNVLLDRRVLWYEGGEEVEVEYLL